MGKCKPKLEPAGLLELERKFRELWDEKYGAFGSPDRNCLREMQDFRRSFHPWRKLSEKHGFLWRSSRPEALIDHGMGMLESRRERLRRRLDRLRPNRLFPDEFGNRIIGRPTSPWERGQIKIPRAEERDQKLRIRPYMAAKVTELDSISLRNIADQIRGMRPDTGEVPRRDREHGPPLFIFGLILVLVAMQLFFITKLMLIFPLR